MGTLDPHGIYQHIGPVSVSRYMAKLRAIGTDWGQDTVMIF